MIQLGIRQLSIFLSTTKELYCESKRKLENGVLKTLTTVWGRHHVLLYQWKNFLSFKLVTGHPCDIPHLSHLPSDVDTEILSRGYENIHILWGKLNSKWKESASVMVKWTRFLFFCFSVLGYIFVNLCNKMLLSVFCQTRGKTLHLSKATRTADPFKKNTVSFVMAA